MTSDLENSTNGPEANPADRGVCPFYGGEVGEGKATCLALDTGSITVSESYAETYCRSARYVECSLFARGASTLPPATSSEREAGALGGQLDGAPREERESEQAPDLDGSGPRVAEAMVDHVDMVEMADAALPVDVAAIAAVGGETASDDEEPSIDDVVPHDETADSVAAAEPNGPERGEGVEFVAEGVGPSVELAHEEPAAVEPEPTPNEAEAQLGERVESTSSEVDEPAPVAIPERRNTDPAVQAWKPILLEPFDMEAELDGATAVEEQPNEAAPSWENGVDLDADAEEQAPPGSDEGIGEAEEAIGATAPHHIQALQEPEATGEIDHRPASGVDQEPEIVAEHDIATEPSEELALAVDQAQTVAAEREPDVEIDRETAVRAEHEPGIEPEAGTGVEQETAVPATRALSEPEQEIAPEPVTAVEMVHAPSTPIETVPDRAPDAATATAAQLEIMEGAVPEPPGESPVVHEVVPPKRPAGRSTKVANAVAAIAPAVEEGRHQWERVPYRQSLRAIGAVLDAGEAREVLVFEGPDEIVVRFIEDGETAEQRLSRERLRTLYTNLKKNRRRIKKNGRYQDLFRALGEYLDESDARIVLIDEVDDTFLLTYQFVGPERGLFWAKRQVVLDAETTDWIRARAHARREYGDGLTALFRRVLQG